MKSTSFKNLRKTTLALAVVAAVCAGSSMAGTASPSLVTMRHAAVLARGDAVMGNLPKGTQVHIVVELNLRNKAKLDEWISNIGKPGHPRIMSAAEWEANHAPTEAQAQAVAKYLKDSGFTTAEIRPGRMVVNALGDRDAVSKAFNTQMVQVMTHDRRVAYANSTDAVIPSSLKPHIFSIVGLETVHMGHTFAKHFDPKAVHTQASSVQGHLPHDFPSIYGNTSLAAASSVVVGIFTQGSMTVTDSDLNKFTAGNGYPTVTTQLVNTDGTGTATSGVDEWDLDSQDIVAQAGGQVSKIIWYQTPSLSTPDMVDNFATIANANATKVINVSIGGCETGSGTTSSGADGDPDFAKAVTQGQTFSISTGDSGADECGNGGVIPSWPADSQYVIASAGTTLTATTGTAAVWGAETEWSGSGGSPSTFETKPSWQTACTATFRCVADVAHDADPNSGSQLYLSGKSPSSSTQVGGTSLAAPLFVGTWARAIQAKGTAIGFAAPLLYGISGASAGTSAAFHDVKSGSNGGETAKVGYDTASGLGSVVGSVMVADLGGGGGGGTPVASFTDTTANLAVTFNNTSTDTGGTATYSWNFGDGSATSSTTSPSHTYAAAGTYNVVLTETDTASGTQSTVTHAVTVTTGSTGGTPVANFTDSVSGLAATFTNTSTDTGGTATYSWNFGDGSAVSTATSPSHTYATAGSYTVVLTETDTVNGHTSTKSAVVTVSGGGSVQLLANTGFESTASWTTTSGVLCPTGCSGESAHGGAGFAWLDGYGSSHTDTVSQTVTVPSGHTAGTLSYYLHIDTAETTTTTAYDKLTVALYSGSTLVRTIATYSNLNKNTGYTVHTNALTSSDLAHTSLTLKFTGTEDTSLQTSFVLDDVTLTAQ